MGRLPAGPLSSCTWTLVAALLAAMPFARAASGGAPLTLAHSGYLLDSSDNPVAGLTALTVRIFDAATDGTLEWQGTCAAVDVKQGYYAVTLGAPGCVGSTAGGLDATLDTSDLPAGAARWLEVVVGTVELTPRLVIASAPTAALASRALTADLLGTHPASDFALATHGHAIAEVTGLQGALNAKLSAETDPKIGTLTTGKWCTESGGQVVCTSDAPSGGGGGVTSITASGGLVVNASTGAVTISDTGTGGKVSRAGDTMTGNLDMSAGNGFFLPPSGTSAQRPAVPVPGMMRWNTTFSVMEFWTGTTWYAINGFSGGNASQTSVRNAAAAMLAATSAAPSFGGALNINGVPMGNYDYVTKQGDQVVSSFLNSEWFTSTADTNAAFVVVNGSLTINAGQTFMPASRKLFTVLYVAGNLTVNGAISMTGRGAAHGGTAAGNLLLASGTFSGVANPQVPAAGGGGAANTLNAPVGVGTTTGTAGTAGVNGGTGGGGGGGNCSSASFTRSSGSAGTSFSGGSGGGATIDVSAAAGNNASVNGGAGGFSSTGGYPSGGGAGNPGGAGLNGGATGGAGTGGVLVIFVAGTLSGSGTISANGMAGGSASGNGVANSGGGGSGGGSITVFYGADSGTITPIANGGAGGTGAGQYRGDGGAGGNGTARKLAL